MRRTAFAVAAVLLVLFVPQASARTPLLTAAEAESVAFQQIMKSSRTSMVEFGVRCERKNRTTMRCRGFVTSEGFYRLKRCRYRLEVRKNPLAKARNIRGQCRNLDVPFLSRKRARRKAMSLLDDRYDPGSIHTASEESSQTSRTRIEFRFGWGDGKEYCVQEVKVALVDAKVRANASEAACVAATEWPRSSR